MELKNKNILITGAAQGIGKGIAEACLNQGANVYLLDINDSLLEATAKELKSSYANQIEFQACELTSDSSFKEALEIGISKFSVFNGFCNSAASSQGIGPFEQFSEEDFDATIKLSFKIVWTCLKQEIEYFRTHQISGSIVNISSNSALRGYAFNSIYAASKAAVNNLSQSVAKEVAKDKIRVNVISPGTVNTPGVQSYFKKDPDAKLRLEKTILLKRLGEPIEIGNAASFLLSDRSSYINGQIISVDGGSSIY
ncbi:MAG: SDR family NAD(P)-dependent oxidoreductase [Gammaproteobacteria bacterium]